MPFTDCRHRGFREKFRANLELIKLFRSTHSPGLTMDVWMWSCSRSWSWNRTRIHSRHSQMPKSTKSPQKLPRDTPTQRYTHYQITAPLLSYPAVCQMLKLAQCVGKFGFLFVNLYSSHPHFGLGGIKNSLIAWGLWSISWKLIRNQMSWDKMSKNSYDRFCCSH